MGRPEPSDLNTDPPAPRLDPPAPRLDPPAPRLDPVPGHDPTTDNDGVGNCNEDEGEGGGGYVASLDLGTTTMRCLVYNRRAEVVGRAQEKINLLYLETGWVEMEPEEVWHNFVNVIRAALSNAKLSAKDIRCLGVSTQRASFITWNKNTDKPLHNFITWKDVRSDTLVKQWNRSFTMKLIRFGSSILYKILRSKRFLAGSVLKLMNIQVNMRLKWVLENNTEAARLAREGLLMFGTLDTWIIHKLSKGKIHATDYSNASGTALYDPFIEDWNGPFLRVFGIPRSIFPELRPSVGNWGSCSAELFGAEIPITAVVSDQGASLFGSFGFERGDVKITLGTGAFMDVNTGSQPHASVKGIYPVHGWKDSQGLVHMAEASSNDNGTVIEWGQTMGLYEHASETSDLAMSATGDNSVYFIPAFQGIQAPLNDARASAGILGLSATTGRPQLVRAMLESLAFRVHQMYSAMRAEADYDLLNISKHKPLRVDGGVAQNDFLLQTIATLIGRPVERPRSTDVTALGTAFLAGMGAGVWESRDELLPLYTVDRVFEPDMDHQPQLLRQMKEWERALERFTKWHGEGSSSSTSNANANTKGSQTTASHPTNQPVIQSTNNSPTQPVNQPTSHPTNHPVIQPVIQPTNQSSNQPTTHPPNQPTNHSPNQPVNQPTNQSSNQQLIQPTTHPTNHPVNHPVIQPTTQPLTQPPSKSPSVVLRLRT
ncbi:hypothetical protein Pmani_038223 [Petrolisthes manimaculis]|uniref:Glycerol kinase 5 n=1 Tax=Petrolisthes manimaculis TaxID=1843537 RepID=A0AAE1TMI5_9EUCA|nr:hypothetical protein Pmani_038223 [Petrolisthes manimaculis]